MATGFRIIEREEGGRARSSEHGGELRSTTIARGPFHLRALEFAGKVFLPAGYPASVSPDYLRYQFFNALQAFCSSLAGLLSSRALLEGFGVGNAHASATNALLLTVLQDFFSRITTICAAYILGPSLSPEAKRFRLLADVSNDAAIVLDTLSPLLSSRFPVLRVAALCTSGVLRALCGIAAGGSKAALAIHFATPTSGAGDIGDLNAKDSSKETVLALLGMLAGSLIVPYLTTPWSTYTVLFSLVGLHLLLNFIGIRGVVLRTLNRQRMSIAWDIYRETAQTKIPTPAEVSALERIFARPGVLRELRTNSVAGRCTIGSSLTAVLRPGANTIPGALLAQMQDERYVLWFDRACLSATPRREREQDELHISTPIHLHICLKEGHTPADQLKAWAHAAEVGRMRVLQQRAASSAQPLHATPAELVLAAHGRVEAVFAQFMQGMRAAGWNTAEAALLPGAPRTVIVSIESTTAPDLGTEEKKHV